MPFIKKEDLSSLYKEIDDNLEKVRICQKQYQLLKSKENASLKRNNSQTMTVLFWIVLTVFLSYGLMVHYKPQWVGVPPKSVSPGMVLVSQDSLSSLQLALNKAPQETEVEDFELDDVPVYAVQIGAFKKKDLSLFSEGFVNFRLFKNRPYNTYSLGNFSTHEEAKAFQRELIILGFKDPVVALFENGKRILINPND
ncbi:MAG: SPOR domain-containing protein [Flavobacteriaceae bacterium]|nr:SPOR domain-containing protein [Flavobacteriaceae bacterium]MDG2313890.1 SPOR domain-containing protein [Flavobacteriaceae bacterium]